jgi:hypothetical protein
MKQRLKAIFCFVASAAFLGLAFTPADYLAEAILSTVLLAIIILLVGLKIAAIWKHRHDPAALSAHISSGQAGVFPDKWRRWFLGEEDRKL